MKLLPLAVALALSCVFVLPLAAREVESSTEPEAVKATASIGESSPKDPPAAEGDAAATADDIGPLPPGATATTSCANGLPPQDPQVRALETDAEWFSFIVTWSGLPVADAQLEVDRRVTFEDQPAHHYAFTAATRGIVEMLYKVESVNESWVATDFSRTLGYAKTQDEAGDFEKVVVDIDWDTNTAQYFNHGNPREPIDIEPGSLDPLSVIFAVRNCRLIPGDTFEVPVTDGKKAVSVKVSVLGREPVETHAGTFDAILVSPETKDLGGVFKKSKNASIDIWLSDDEWRIPLKLSSKVVIGSFHGELVDSSLHQPGQPYEGRAYTDKEWKQLHRKHEPPRRRKYGR